MSRNQIKISSITAIAVAILFNLIVISESLTAKSADYLILDIEMNNPATFDRDLMESMQNLDRLSGRHVRTGVVTFHLPDGDKIQMVMDINEVRQVLSGQMRYSDFIGNHVTVL